MLSIFNAEKNFFIILIIAVLIDFITGVTGAVLQKNFKSSKLRAGVEKYIWYFAFAVVGCLTQYVFNLQLAHYFITIPIAIELISVIENFGKITGVNSLTEIIKSIKEKAGIKDNDDI